MSIVWLSWTEWWKCTYATRYSPPGVWLHIETIGFSLFRNGSLEKLSGEGGGGGEFSSCIIFFVHVWPPPPLLPSHNVSNGPFSWYCYNFSFWNKNLALVQQQWWIRTCMTLTDMNFLERFHPVNIQTEKRKPGQTRIVMIISVSTCIRYAKSNTKYYWFWKRNVWPYKRQGTPNPSQNWKRSNVNFLVF